MQAYSRRVPSGERLPGVLWPWAGSRRMSMALRATARGFRGEGRENFAIFAPMYNLNKIVY